MRVTLKDIAKHTGFSVAAVGFALGNQANRLSPETRECILAAAKELGYRPNSMGRALVTGKTHLIGISLPVLHTPYYAMIAHHFLQKLQADGYDALFRQYSYNLKVEATWVVDGMIYVDDVPRSALHPSSVVVGNVLHQSEDIYCDVISVHLGTAASELLRYFLACGRRRITYVADVHGQNLPEDRSKAYQQAMADANLPIRLILAPDQSRAATRQVVRDYFQACAPADWPDALFCHNDDMALAAYRALCDLGISVPETVALAGCDAIEDGEYIPCPLTTIRQPIDVMCDTAIASLKRRMIEPKAPRHTVQLAGELLLRGTTPRLD